MRGNGSPSKLTLYGTTTLNGLFIHLTTIRCFVNEQRTLCAESVLVDNAIFLKTALGRK